MILIRHLALLALTACLAPMPLAAQDAVDATEQGLLRYFAAHDYVHAGGLPAAAASHADDGNMAYNLACALAREGKRADAWSPRSRGRRPRLHRQRPCSRG